MSIIILNLLFIFIVFFLKNRALNIFLYIVSSFNIIISVSLALNLFGIPDLKLIKTETFYIAQFLNIIYFTLIIYYRNTLSKLQIILTWCSMLCAAIIICNQDLFIILYAFEFLVLANFLIICVAKEVKPALLYAVINFLSGAIIMAAIAGQNYNLTSITEFNAFNKTLLLIGILMHCGAFPISDAIIKGYSSVNAACATFLQIFSTKAALIMLYKIFDAEELLFYSAVLTILYCIIYSFKENNIRKLIVYNTIGQIGLFILAIYADGNIIWHVTASLLYQTLLYIIVYEITTKAKKTLLTELVKIKINSPILMFAILVITASMMGLPGTLSFVTKSIMLQNASNYTEYLFMFGNFSLVLTVALKMFYALFLSSRKIIKIKLDKIKSFIISCFCIALLLPIKSDSIGNIYSAHHIFTSLAYASITVLIFISIKRFLYKQKSIKHGIDFFYTDFLKYIFLSTIKFLDFTKEFISKITKFEVKSIYRYQNILQEEAIEFTSLFAIIFIGTFLLFKFIF